MYLELSFRDAKTRICLAPFYHLLGYNAIIMVVIRWLPLTLLLGQMTVLFIAAVAEVQLGCGLSRMLLLSGNADRGELLHAAVLGREQGL